MCVAILFRDYVPPESFPGAAAVVMYAPAVLFNVAAGGISNSLLLTVSPQAAVGDICGVNIFRSVYYTVSPASDYFLVLPDWRKSALVYLGAALILTGLRYGLLKWTGLKPCTICGPGR